MSCQKCKSERIVNLTAKCSDCSGVRLGDREHDGYVPDDLGVGGGDYVELEFCLECGQIQGKWPKPKAKLEIPPHCPQECGYQGMPEDNSESAPTYRRHIEKYKCPQCGAIGDDEAWGLN